MSEHPVPLVWNKQPTFFMLYLITETNITHAVPKLRRVGATLEDQFVYSIDVLSMGDATPFMHSYGGSISRSCPELKPSGCVPPIVGSIPQNHFATS